MSGVDRDYSRPGAVVRVGADHVVAIRDAVVRVEPSIPTSEQTVRCGRQYGRTATLVVIDCNAESSIVCTAGTGLGAER